MNENNLTENNISGSMEHSHTDTLDDISKPTWENIVESPIIDYVSASMPSSKYKLKLKYGGIFRLSNQLNAAFIAFIRDANWEKYVDQYFTIEKFKEAYQFQIAPLPGKDQWMQKDGEKIYAPIITRPAGRPRKNRIKASTESKRRHKCPRCGEYGHRELIDSFV
ncbi:hypothetical protein LXL04_009531 [Taraxacum kok-saghyz]